MIKSVDPKNIRRPKFYVCPLCDKIQENMDEYVKHRLEECEKTTDENKKLIQDSLRKIGLYDG